MNDYYSYQDMQEDYYDGVDLPDTEHWQIGSIVLRD